MKFILNLLLFITLFFTDSLLAFNSAIQSGIYGTNFKDSLLSNISSSTSSYLFNKAGDIGVVTNSKDGSLTKTALHSLVGGSVNAIQGDSFIDGALISGINELLSPLSKNLNKNEQILTSQLTGILTGALINSEAGAKQGYNLTTSAEMYNRQLHKDEIEFINNKDNINKFKEYYKKQTNKSITDKEAMDLLLLSGKYMVNANDNGIINLQNNKFINMFNIFGKPEYSKDEINTAMGFLIDKSKGLKFIDNYKEEFTPTNYFSATKEQFYDNNYNPNEAQGLGDMSLVFIPTSKVGESTIKGFRGIYYNGKNTFKQKSIKNPLENTKYTKKVLIQKSNKNDYFHSFPDSVDAFAKYGKKTKIIGKDGVKRTKIEISGNYKNQDGVFEYIIEPDNTINHRFFRVIGE